VELSGANGGPITVQAVRTDALARLDPVALEALRRLNGSTLSLPSPDDAIDAETAEQGEGADSESPAGGEVSLSGQISSITPDANDAPSEVLSPLSVGDSERNE